MELKSRLLFLDTMDQCIFDDSHHKQHLSFVASKLKEKSNSSYCITSTRQA